MIQILIIILCTAVMCTMMAAIHARIQPISIEEWEPMPVSEMILAMLAFLSNTVLINIMVIQLIVKLTGHV